MCIIHIFLIVLENEVAVFADLCVLCVAHTAVCYGVSARVEVGVMEATALG